MPTRHAVQSGLLIVTLMLGFGGCGQLTCDSELKASRAANNRAIGLQKQGQYEAAEKEFRNAMALKPSNHKAAYNLGVLFESQGKWEQAKEAYNEALKRNDKNPMYFYDAGHAYLEWACPEQKEGGRSCSTPPDEAIKNLERAVKMRDSLFKGWYYLGVAHELKDEPREAAIAYTKSARANGRFLEPFIDLTKLYPAWDKWAEAQRIATAALSVPENRAQRQNATMLYFLQGRASEFLNQNEKALEAYNNAVQTDEGNVNATFHLGVLYAKLGNKAQAKEWLEKAIKKGGGNANLVATANSILYQQIK